MAEQVRDITARVRLAVGGHHLIEPDAVLQPLDGRAQPVRRLIDLAYDPARHRQDTCHALRVRRRHHPPSASDLVEILGRNAIVPALVQTKEQREVALRHGSRIDAPADVRARHVW